MHSVVSYVLHELLSSSVTSNQGNKSTNISSDFFSVLFEQETQLLPSDRAMHLVSSNLANFHATVQKLLIRQVLTKLMYEIGDLVGGSVS